ncbi:cupin domain-containing protein [Mucilaginibacter rubeus]|uniref:Cupin domain-containing protein n=1 Tax=Mucilaginibacter rubeus TaxID=2027860 RepID=A0A5C1HTZ3_9SPHI|nr:cupin domain-containing protein [Mucilaginibacter rubeus]QEM08923.1 cupin domain-containing protein [Mucilaginibacter rubeus]
MKRGSFVHTLIGATALLAMPFEGIAKGLSKIREKKGYKIDSGADRVQKPMHLFEGDTFYTKISTADTDGDLYVYESTRVKKGGPNLHLHHEQDEWWYILDGEFQIKVGDQLFHAKPGDSVFGPRGVPHTFTKIGDDSPAKMLITFQPAGKMEACFQALSDGLMKGKTETELDDFRKQHGFERVGPPLDYYKKF